MNDCMTNKETANIAIIFKFKFGSESQACDGEYESYIGQL